MGSPESMAAVLALAREVADRLGRIEQLVVIVRAVEQSCAGDSS